jgi:hypothetical protein
MLHNGTQFSSSLHYFSNFLKGKSMLMALSCFLCVPLSLLSNDLVALQTLHIREGYILKNSRAYKFMDVKVVIRK